MLHGVSSSARRAAVAAVTTSAVLASGTCHSTSPVAGSRAAKVRSSAVACSTPSTGSTAADRNRLLMAQLHHAGGPTPITRTA